MKKVDFGFENSSQPIGSHEGLGVTGQGIGPVSGEYLGIVNLMNNNYLVTRITDTFKNSENEINKIDVREAIADIYPDASGILYINQEKSHECIVLEQLLNSEKTTRLIENGNSIQEICSGSKPSFAFDCVTRDENVIATAIKPDIFEYKKQLIGRCHSSFSNMQEVIEKVNMNETDKNKSL